MNLDRRIESPEHVAIFLARFFCWLLLTALCFTGELFSIGMLTMQVVHGQFNSAFVWLVTIAFFAWLIYLLMRSA
jgi:hypothetical protein